APRARPRRRSLRRRWPTPTAAASCWRPVRTAPACARRPPLPLELDPTVVTVAAGAVLLGLTSGALGTFAVLRRQSLLGDVMSHAALPGVVGGYLVAGTRTLPAMLAGALVTGLAAAALAWTLHRRLRVKSEAALGAVLGLGFALGVVLL